MTIEDVQYLYDHSVKDGFIVYIDSSLRNREFYPHPSEYTVEFSEPFKNVVGVDVLDATIPATQYNVDVLNNQLCGWFYKLNPISGRTLQLILDELSLVPEFDSVMSEKLSMRKVVVTTFDLISSLSITVDSTSAYGLLRRGEWSNITLYNFSVYEKYIAANNISVVKFTASDGIEYGIENNPDDTIAQTIIALVSSCTAIVTPLSDNKANLILYRYDNIRQSIYGVITTSSPTPLYWIIFNMFTATLEVGNYGISSFMAQLKTQISQTELRVEPASAGDISISAKLLFNCDYPFVLDMEKSTLRTGLGFDEYVVNTRPSEFGSLSYKRNRRLFTSYYNQSKERYELKAPGIIFLLGASYCILRCPEIEDHLYLSRAYGKFSPGIALFKLFAVNDVKDQRLDFSSFQKKPMHPIGKLSRITLRFEEPSGKLYDFKAANHVMLILIRYLVPSQKFKFERSILNPNYQPDYKAYMAKNIDYREGSEDEVSEGGASEEDAFAFRNKYLKKQNKYDYSSSDDEGQVSDDSEIDIEVVKERRLDKA
jgi:hypothetical protein